MTDRMFRKIKMLSNGFVLLLRISLFCLFIYFLVLFSVSLMYIALGQNKQDSRYTTLDKVHINLSLMINL